MGISKTSDHIKIKIKMQNPSQEHPASSKAPNQDLKDMDVLCTFKIKIESLQHPPKPKIRTYRTHMVFAPSKSRWRAKIQIMGISKTSNHIQIKIKMPNPSQEPPASSKAPNEDLKDMDVLCTFKIKIDSQNLAYGCTKDH